MLVADKRDFPPKSSALPRPARKLAGVRMAWAFGALVTFVLGFILSPGWWVFTPICVVLALSVGRKNSGVQVVRHESWGLDSPLSLHPNARLKWGPSLD